MTSDKGQRLWYRDGIVAVKEVQYYLLQLAGEQDPSEIILLLCAAGDLLDNILENPAEEAKEKESRKLTDIALKKLKNCEKDPQKEDKETITCFKRDFMKIKKMFDERSASIGQRDLPINVSPSTSRTPLKRGHQLRSSDKEVQQAPSGRDKEKAKKRKP